MEVEKVLSRYERFKQWWKRVLRRLKEEDNEIINVVCIENKQYVEIPRRFVNNVEDPIYRQYGEKGRMKVREINAKFKPDVLGIWKVNHDGSFKTRHTTINDLDMFMRMVILRQWAYFVIYNWDKLPRQHVWYFWYDVDRLNRLRDMWRIHPNDQSVKNIHIIQEPPHDETHVWKYCCDPTEGGTIYTTFEKVKDDETGKERRIKKDDKYKNPYQKGIVDMRLTPESIFGEFPFTDLKNEFPILKS